MSMFLMSKNALAQTSAVFGNKQLPFESIELTWNGQSENIPYTTLSRWMTRSSILLPDKNGFAETENIYSCPNSEFLACDLLLTQKNRYRIRLASRFSFDEQAATSFVSELAQKIDEDPIDAKFNVDDGKVTTFTQEKSGLKLNVSESVKKISELFSNYNQADKIPKLELSINSIEPSVTASQINNLGISTLIGQGKSNFRGSTKNRIYNIKVAIERFNGVLIKPGEEFSFVSTLGEVDGEHGYLPELVIKNDRTEPEFGGGICQVSTTAFRAAIYSGLKITARRNHAYPVSYYNPQGMDSTIYVPKPDLKFINNTPKNILIQVKIIGTELIFDFYGTDDGRKIEVDGPKILERGSDGSLKTTFTQKVTDANGNVIINDTFNSNYESPDKFPHPVDPSKITTKPKDWSQKQWEYFKKTGLLPTN